MAYVAMSLPPRRKTSVTKIPKRCLTPLETLLQMGFSRSRALKALASTGYRGVQLASDWLLAHVNDPNLDDNCLREFVLYAVPIGALNEELLSFWNCSLKECGWNGAHNCLPHITLIPYFKVPNEKVERTSEILKKVLDNYDLEELENMKLEAYISQNYMGFFVSKKGTEILKDVSKDFMKEMEIEDMHFATDDKSLHLTLAYQFSPEHFTRLKTLVVQIPTDVGCKWEIRLYSKDPIFATKQVYKVLYSHLPQNPDELELMMDDFVYVTPNAIETSPDGWIEGTSWLTGVTGLLPANYIERTAVSDSWTLHRIADDKGKKMALSFQKYYNRPRDLSTTAMLCSVDAATQSSPASEKTENERDLYIMRHGERVDFTFGKWVQYSFDNEDRYMRMDMNMPPVLPKRAGGTAAFATDSPLTVIGEMQARLTGEAMRDNNIKIDHVYVSPSLRCIQTGNNVIQGLGREGELGMCIEPGLFEWSAWYTEGLPAWLNKHELRTLGYNVDFDYIPILTAEDLIATRESLEEFYDRGYYVTSTLVNKTNATGGNLLLIGHAASLDTCSRQLLGGKPRTAAKLMKLLQRVYYCSVLRLHYSQSHWAVLEAQFPPLTHTSNPRFDHTIM